MSAGKRRWAAAHRKGFLDGAAWARSNPNDGGPIPTNVTTWLGDNGKREDFKPIVATGSELKINPAAILTLPSTHLTEHTIWNVAVDDENGHSHIMCADWMTREDAQKSVDHYVENYVGKPYPNGKGHYSITNVRLIREAYRCCIASDNQHDEETLHPQPAPSTLLDGRPATNGSQPPCAIFEGVADDDGSTDSDRSLRVSDAKAPPQTNTPAAAQTDNAATASIIRAVKNAQKRGQL